MAALSRKPATGTAADFIPAQKTLPVLTHGVQAGGPLAVGLGAVIGVVVLAIALVATRRRSPVARRSELA